MSADGRQFILPIADELIVDLFAGGGGMSIAIERAIGRHVDIAANHDDGATSMHRANHPQTRHFIADVFEVDPRGAVRAKWGAGNPRSRTSPENWKLPIRWNKEVFWQCKECGFRGTPGDFQKSHTTCVSSQFTVARRRVFCASLGDVFDNEVPIEWLIDLLDLIRRTPNLDWLLLTKRIGNWRPRIKAAHAAICAVSYRVPPGLADVELAMWLSDWMHGDAPSNVWLGATVVNQEEAGRDIPKLLAVPARIRFLSIEPMLGPVDLQWQLWRRMALEEIPGWALNDGCTEMIDKRGLLHWVICGGESGPHARPMHPEWALALRDQCEMAAVPFLFKQWGEWAPISQVPEKVIDAMYRSNRKAKADEDQSALDESYGRTCTVETTCIWLDGSVRPILEPMAFLQGKGGMSCFRIGKKSAGRLLDNREWNGFPQERS